MIEIEDVVRTTFTKEELASMEDILYKLYCDIKQTGSTWVDCSLKNIGILEKPNKVKSDFGAISMENTRNIAIEELTTGSPVIIDLDYVVTDKQLSRALFMLPKERAQRATVFEKRYATTFGQNK